MTRRLAPAAVLLALAGCSSQSTVIEGDDSSFFASARLTIPTGNDETAFEVDVSTASGGFEQKLGPTDDVQLDKVTFSGPGKVDVDFDLTRVALVGRRTFTEESGLGLAVFLGLDVTRLDARASQLGAKDDVRDTGYGFQFGVEPFYHVATDLKLYGELAITNGLATEYNKFDLTSIDVGLAYAPWERFEIAVGWRHWRYETEGIGNDSDLDLTLHGPHVSLRFTP